MEHARWEVQDGVEVALLQQHLTQLGSIAIAEEGVFNHDAGTATSLQHLDEVLHEHVGGLAGAQVEVLQHLASFRTSKGRIGQDDILAVFLLHLCHVLGQRVATDDVRRLHPMENHVHRSDDVRQRLLLLAEEGLFLQYLVVVRAFDFLRHVGKGLAKEACRATSRVVDRLAYLRVDHLHDGTNERARRVVLAAVAPCIAHALNLRLIEQRHLMFVLCALEVQRIHEIDDFAQVVAAGNLIAQLGENLTYLIFECVGAAGRRLELA